jgi:hypothetical protein
LANFVSARAKIPGGPIEHSPPPGNMEFDAKAKTFHYSADEAKRAQAEKLDGS